jgi:phospholipid/cholesterol/gamma-HCH transport system permease protein
LLIRDLVKQARGAAMAPQRGLAKGGWVKASGADGQWILAVGGRWLIAEAAELAGALRAAIPERLGPSDHVRVDMAAVETLDTSGAWILYSAGQSLAQAGVAVVFEGAQAAHAGLLDRVAKAAGTDGGAGQDAFGGILGGLAGAPLALAERIGRGTIAALVKSRDLLSFFGLTIVIALRSLAAPWRIRFIALFSHMEQVGLNALPIVGLLSFLIGVVLAFQGADQLRQFGAEIFTVNLLGVSILRELGIVITAIVVAGRSGSAFTAQIGTMKVNQEVDAMVTLGLDPIEVLVLPRLFALVIMLPLLALYADIMGLLGGAVMSMIVLDISPTQFINQLHDAVDLSTFMIGVAKAPVFAFLIALVGCFEGLQVEGSADSVGRHTTTAVVESIFLVITFDAMFSVMFSIMGI